MAETKLVVEHREHLWNLLVQACQVEHLIMCQYLYAGFSLKTGPDEGLTAEQADAVARWHQVLTGIAVEEMLHFALVANVMTAIGAAPSLTRPNFPRRSEYLPPGVQFALLPFGDAALTHFLYGIPVYAIRGSLGGFELLQGFRSALPAAATGPVRSPGPPGPNVQRARVRLSPRGRRLAA